MANWNVNRTGQKDGAGDADALFLMVWSGEVINAFRESNVALGRSMTRQITSGKSAQFPATWKATASYHTPGVELQGSQINQNERIITIDDLLVSDVTLDVLDEAKNHADYRGEYTFQLGAALSKVLDQNLLRLGILSARASATVSGGNGGTVITDADALTASTAGVDSLISSIYDAAQAFDEKDVPADNRFVYVKPAQYYNLIELSTKAIHRDYGGDGSVSDGTIRTIAGVEIVKTNNLPQANVATGPSTYQGDFSTVAASVQHRSSVGTVKLLDMATEMEYSVRHQGWLIVSKYALGSGILRPESSVEIKTS